MKVPKVGNLGSIALRIWKLFIACSSDVPRDLAAWQAQRLQKMKRRINGFVAQFLGEVEDEPSR